MRLIVSVDLLHPRTRLSRMRKGDNTSACWKPLGKAGGLNDNRASACQAAGAALAKPTAVRGDVAVLRHAELGFRLHDERLVRPRVFRHFERVAHLTTKVATVLRCLADGQLE